jgi:uncharacterized protein YciI
MAAPVRYWILFYDYVADVLERRAPFREEHLRLAREAADRGELLLGGALADPVDAGVLVWRTADAAPIERFVEADPYVRNGVVTRHRIRPWTVVVGSFASEQTR